MLKPDFSKLAGKEYGLTLTAKEHFLLLGLAVYWLDLICMVNNPTPETVKRAAESLQFISSPSVEDVIGPREYADLRAKLDGIMDNILTDVGFSGGLQDAVAYGRKMEMEDSIKRMFADTDINMGLN